ncbi:hypothetical protein ACIGD1_25150 [Streptomyces sp. NPDC085612]|uniref:hypothetical protein n=1 Tax=Streptomyces sp. NPDC085612 TaxID=3365732 RepID=UPI0037D2619B
MLAGPEPAGAAAFGRWLRLTDRLLTAHGDAVREAVLLTDLTATAGSREELSAVLASCAGRFTCHARGIGAHWDVAQLRSITTALSGTLDIVTEPAAPTSGLIADLTGLADRTRRAAARTLALRIAVQDGCQVRFLKQLTPSVDDLTVRGHPVGRGTTEYPVDVPDGASYNYHLRFDLPDGREGGRVGAELSIVLLPPAGDGQTLVRVPVTARRRP